MWLGNSKVPQKKLSNLLTLKKYDKNYLLLRVINFFSSLIRSFTFKHSVYIKKWYKKESRLVSIYIKIILKVHILAIFFFHGWGNIDQEETVRDESDGDNDVDGGDNTVCLFIYFFLVS